MASFPSGSLPTFTSRQARPSQADKKADKLRTVMQEIDQLVGLDNVKRELENLIAFARVIAIRRERDIPVGRINLHTVFTGPPGTGKTVVARKVGRMLHAIGLLKRGECVEVDRAQLVSPYMGQTAQRVTEKVKDALDSVLFIDEAYTLLGPDPVNNPDPYGKEAVDTLLKLMEDHRDRLVVIIAGYTNEIRRFIESNPGLKSRFSREISFESYGVDELVDIFQAMVRDGHYCLTPEAEKEARKHIHWLRGSADENFGNARAVRHFFESILPVQAMRIAFIPDLEQQPDAVLLTIEAEDVLAVTDVN